MKSLKQLLWAGAAIAVLASCSAEEEYALDGAIRPGEEAITISSYIPGKRAVDKTTFAEGDVIGLYACQTAGAYANSFRANFMDNVAVTKGADDWTYSPMMAWPSDENEHLSFIAFYPRNTESTASAVRYPLTVNSDVDQQVDVLWCTIRDAHINDRNGIRINGNSEAASFEAASGPLSLQFKHMLSKVIVQVKLADGYSGTTAKLKSLSLNNANSSGFFALNSTLSLASGGSWTSNTPTNFTLHTDTDEPKDIITTAETVATMFMIPQDITAYHTSLNVAYSYSLPDGTEKEVTEEIYLPNTWEINKAYNYVINIEPDIEMINISPSIVDWDSPTETPAIGNDIAEAIDLGLSVKWASHDFGAVSPYDIGIKYSAEDTRTQNFYPAWGLGWIPPEQRYWQELISNSTITSEEINGRTCYRATATNGNAVIFSNRYYYTWSSEYVTSTWRHTYYRIDLETKHFSQLSSDNTYVSPSRPIRPVNTN